MRFAMLICGDEDEWDESGPRPNEEAAMDRIRAWFEKWQAAGRSPTAVRSSTAHAPRRRSGPVPDGPVVTDGPYLELKEVIGGFVVLEAEDIDEAVAIAAEWPSLTGVVQRRGPPRHAR